MTGPDPNALYLQYAGTVLFLGILEALLSADNALVLALLVQPLEPRDQKRVLSYGLGGAVIFRLIFILLAKYLIDFWYFKAVGALYLLYMAVVHFWRRNAEKTSAQPVRSFWRAVIQVELTDLMFSIDSIIVAVGMSSNLYVVYAGGVLGIITMRFVAVFFIRLLERFPLLENSAFAIVGWIGFKMISEIVYVLRNPGVGENIGYIPQWIFWLVMLLLFGAGFIARKKPEKSVANDLPVK